MGSPGSKKRSALRTVASAFATGRNEPLGAENHACRAIAPSSRLARASSVELAVGRDPVRIEAEKCGVEVEAKGRPEVRGH